MLHTYVLNRGISYSTKSDHHDLGDLDRLRDILSDDIQTFHFVWSTTRAILKIIDVLPISVNLVCCCFGTGHNLDSGKVPTVKWKTWWAFLLLPLIILQRIYNKVLIGTSPIVTDVKIEWSILIILGKSNADPSCLQGSILHVDSITIT